MRLTLAEFQKSIEGLDSFVASLKEVYNTLSIHEDDLVRAGLSQRKRLDYISVITSLYANFEFFIEELAWSFADWLSRENSYDDLPKALSSKNLIQSADLLSRRHLGRGRYKHISDEIFVKNLHSCLSRRSTYSLNKLAVVHHDSNLRIDEIQKVFSGVGIENLPARVRKERSFLHFYNELVESTSDTVPSDWLSLKIDPFVETRNQIAHRAHEVDQIQGDDELKELLLFLRMLGASIYRVVIFEYLVQKYLSNEDSALLLGKSVEGPFQDGRVIVVNAPKQRLFLGQQVFGACSEDVRQLGNIEEIQSDDSNLEEFIPGHNDGTLGLKLSFKAGRNWQFHAIPFVDGLI